MKKLNNDTIDRVGIMLTEPKNIEKEYKIGFSGSFYFNVQHVSRC